LHFVKKNAGKQAWWPFPACAKTLGGSLMATEQLYLPGHIVNKANEMVRCRVTIDSVDSGRILDSLIAQINSQEPQFEAKYSIQIPKCLLKDKDSRGGSQYALIRKACKELSRAGAEYQVDESTERYLNLFSHIDYNRKQKQIIATFNPFAAPLLLNLVKFAQYELFEFLKLSTRYAQKMYEILKSWQNAGGCDLPIDKLHHWLDTPPSFRNNFAQFRLYVLNKVHKEITTKTNLKYHWIPIKKDKKTVIGIRVTFGNPAKLPAGNKSSMNSEIAKENNSWAMKALHCAKSRTIPCPKKTTKKCDACKRMGYLEALSKAAQ
jgi:plasmid replication initiation protein